MYRHVSIVLRLKNLNLSFDMAENSHVNVCILSICFSGVFEFQQHTLSSEDDILIVSPILV